MSVNRGVAELNRAHELARSAQFEEALAIADQAAVHLASDAAGHAAALELAADIASRLGQVDEALARLVALDAVLGDDPRRRWLARQSAAAVSRRLGDPRAVELAREASSAARGVSEQAAAHSLGELAGALSDAGRLAEADDLLHSALIACREPEAGEILVVHRVELALALGRAQDALAMCEAAGQGSPRLTRARASALTASGRAAEAVELLRTLDPTSLESELGMEVLVTLGAALRALGQGDEERVCHEAIVRHGDAELPHVVLESWSRLAVLRSGAAAIEAGLATASLAARLGDREAAGLINLRAGQDAAAAGALTLARAGFERAAGFSAGPARVTALAMLGQVLVALGETERGHRTLEQAASEAEDPALRRQISALLGE